MTLTFTEIADTAVREYLKQRQQGLLPDQAHAVMHDVVKEMAQHVVIIEEPECCDALLRTDWLHHSSCPEVVSHHCEHDTKHPDCPACNLQRRAQDSLPD